MFRAGAVKSSPPTRRERRRAPGKITSHTSGNGVCARRIPVDRIGCNARPEDSPTPPRVEWAFDGATGSYTVSCFRGQLVLASVIVTAADATDTQRLSSLLSQLQSECVAASVDRRPPATLNEE